MWKSVGKAILYPPMAVPVLLLPVATAFLVWAMATKGTESAWAIVSYVVAAYTLTVWCVRVPYLIRTARQFRDSNRIVKRWREDARFRINVSLYGTLIWNAVYAAFQLWLGVYHHTFWYISFSVYYALLAVMRFFLLRYTRSSVPGQRLRDELKRQCACGAVLLVMNLSLALMVFFMVYWGRTFVHHEITAIAMAAYTFTAFVSAIVSAVRYRKEGSPVYSAAKAIGLVAACVSMLTLESTMLTTWGQGDDPMLHRILLATTGAAICCLIVVMAISMIATSTKQLRQMKTEDKKYAKQ